MIKVKINDLLNSVETLQKLSNQNFKAKLAWQVARLIRAAESELQTFNDTRLNLIRKYGEKDENGDLLTDENNNYKIIPDKANDFSNELNELANSEVEINAKKLDFALLEDLDFTPVEMAVLEPFVDMK